MLASVGVISIILGLISAIFHWQRRNYREHSAVVAVSGLGGTYGMESGFQFGKTGIKPNLAYYRLFNRVASIDLSEDTWPKVEQRKKGQANNRTTDDDLSVLYYLTDLKSLDLSGSAVTDDGIPYLIHLRSLEQLEIDGTSISDAGYQKLREALPDCTICRVPPAS